MNWSVAGGSPRRFSLHAASAAVFDAFPVMPPLLAPTERAITDRADLLRQVFFANPTRHGKRSANRVKRDLALQRFCDFGGLAERVSRMERIPPGRRKTDRDPNLDGRGAARIPPDREIAGSLGWRRLLIRQTAHMQSHDRVALDAPTPPNRLRSIRSRTLCPGSENAVRLYSQRP